MFGKLHIRPWISQKNCQDIGRVIGTIWIRTHIWHFKHFQISLALWWWPSEHASQRVSCVIYRGSQWRSWVSESTNGNSQLCRDPHQFRPLVFFGYGSLLSSFVSFFCKKKPFGGAFWADTAPFLGPQLASFVASGTTEIQGQRQVCRARHGGPMTPSTTTDANLDFEKSTE